MLYEWWLAVVAVVMIKEVMMVVVIIILLMVVVVMVVRTDVAVSVVMVCGDAWCQAFCTYGKET